MASQFIAKTREQTFHQFTRTSGAIRVTSSTAFFEELPVVAETTPDIVDSMLNRSIKTEVLFAIALQGVVRLYAVQYVIREEMTVYMYACIFHRNLFGGVVGKYGIILC